MTCYSYCCKDNAWYVGATLQQGKCLTCKHALCTDCIVVEAGKRYKYGDYVRAVAQAQLEREAEQAADAAVEPDSDQDAEGKTDEGPSEKKKK